MGLPFTPPPLLHDPHHQLLIGTERKYGKSERINCHWRSLKKSTMIRVYACKKNIEYVQHFKQQLFNALLETLLLSLSVFSTHTHTMHNLFFFELFVVGVSCCYCLSWTCCCCPGGSFAMMDISHAGGASEKTSAMQHTPTVDLWGKKTRKYHDSNGKGWIHIFKTTSSVDQKIK